MGEMKFNSVTIRVPASTSNLGSGFDTLGLAVRLYNLVGVTRLSGRGPATVLSAAGNPTSALTEMIAGAAQLFFRRTKLRPFRIEVAQRSKVPVGRGLGASATVRLGVVAGLNDLCGAGLSRQSLLEMVTELEGHPDNASPATLGGFTVSGRIGGEVRCLRFPVHQELKLVALLPPFELSTKKARAVLPAAYSRADAAHALNRSALITAALASGNYEALRGVFDDRVHQPYREPLIPQLTRVIRAGEKAGALGGFLSGAGSGIICLTLEKPGAVATAMRRQLPESKVRILTPDNRGFLVVRSAEVRRSRFVSL